MDEKLYEGEVRRIILNQNRERYLRSKTGYCWYCGIKLSKGNFTVDHKIAKSRGGRGRKNKFPCCKKCNNLKSDQPVDFLREELRKKAETNDYRYVRFTSQQLKYLESIGVDISQVKPKRYKFYYEIFRDGTDD
jgi:5-methylcytosine-specific restriction endonuclease McrA